MRPFVHKKLPRQRLLVSTVAESSGSSRAVRECLPPSHRFRGIIGSLAKHKQLLVDMKLNGGFGRAMWSRRTGSCSSPEPVAFPGSSGCGPFPRLLVPSDADMLDRDSVLLALNQTENRREPVIDQQTCRWPNGGGRVLGIGERRNTSFINRGDDSIPAYLAIYLTIFREFGSTAPSFLGDHAPSSRFLADHPCDSRSCRPALDNPGGSRPPIIKEQISIRHIHRKFIHKKIFMQ